MLAMTAWEIESLACAFGLTFLRGCVCDGKCTPLRFLRPWILPILQFAAERTQETPESRSTRSADAPRGEVGSCEATPPECLAFACAAPLAGEFGRGVGLNPCGREQRKCRAPVVNLLNSCLRAFFPAYNHFEYATPRSFPHSSTELHAVELKGLADEKDPHALNRRVAHSS